MFRGSFYERNDVKFHSAFGALYLILKVELEGNAR